MNKKEILDEKLKELKKRMEKIKETKKQEKSEIKVLENNYKKLWCIL